MKFNKIEGKRSKLVRVAAAGLMLAFLILTINPAAAAMQARFIRWAGTVKPITVQKSPDKPVPPKLLVAAGGGTTNQAPLVITGEVLIDNETGFHRKGTSNYIAEVVIAPEGSPARVDQPQLKFTADYLRRAALYGINDMVQGHYQVQGELPPGIYRYAVRFSVDNGTTWTYAGQIDDFNPLSPDPTDLGWMEVVERTNFVQPNAPQNLQVTNVKAEEIKLSWSMATLKPGGSPIYGYHIFRSTTDNSATAKLVGQSIGSVQFLDEFLQDGGTYYYWVKAFDTNYNYSGFSNSVMVETPELPKFYLPIVKR